MIKFEGKNDFGKHWSRRISQDVMPPRGELEVAIVASEKGITIGGEMISWAEFDEERYFEHKRIKKQVKVLQQMVMEVSHAQQKGPGWYTRGTDGMFQQVQMWIGRGQAAIDEINR